MSLINNEELTDHVRELIGAEYVRAETGEGFPRFERELYGRFIISVIITGIDTGNNSVLSKVRLERKAEPREIYEGVYEWAELESKVVPEDVLTAKLNTFNVIARLCIERPEEDGMLFVWGIKSPDEESEEDADIYTKNDIDIVYNLDTDYFSLSIDTDYFFDTDADQKQYAADLLTELKHFMRNTGLNTHVLLSLDEMTSYNLFSDFEDLETLYAAARMILLGYSR
jgi:hypothetical protein